MTDATYVSKVHGEGSDKLTIESGGTLEINSGATVTHNATETFSAAVTLAEGGTLSNTKTLTTSGIIALGSTGSITAASGSSITLAAGSKLKEGDTMAQYDGNQFYRVAVAHVDCSVAGAGTAEAHATTIKIPDNAIVTKAWYDVTTQPASADSTAQIALHLQSANDLVTATVITDAKWTAGVKACTPAGAAANMIKMTAQRAITYTVSVQALTDGKFDIFVEYMPGN